MVWSSLGIMAPLWWDRQGWEVIAESLQGKARMEPVPLIEKGGESGLDQHVINFLECMKTRETPNVGVEIGGHIAGVEQLGNIALRKGNKIFWDGDKGEVMGDEKAKALTRASYREPWKLPVL